jgi:hypothetical protein
MNTLTFEALLKARKGPADIVDIPEFGFAMVTGSGPPGGTDFTRALQALYAVRYGAHFLVKKQRDQAPKVMPFGVLWWIDGPGPRHPGCGRTGLGHHGRHRSGTLAVAGHDHAARPDERRHRRGSPAQARQKKPSPGLNRLCHQHWAEGLCAQLRHVGSYVGEGPSIAGLHQSIAAAGVPRRAAVTTRSISAPRSAPQKLRTIFGQPIERQLR